MKFEKLKNKTLKKLRNTLIGSIFVHIIRWILFHGYRKNYSLISPSIKYHEKISYVTAKYIVFIFKPVAIILKKNNIFISINNISYAVGHIYPEIDYLYRIRILDSRFKDAKILYAYPKNPILCGVQEIFSSKEVQIFTSGLLNLFLYTLALRYPEIRIDAAQSNVKHEFLSDYDKPSSLSHKETFRIRQVAYAKARTQTTNYYPLRKNYSLTKELNNLIKSDKYVVIQIKDTRVNGTFNPVNPETYISSIEYLLNKNFKIVLGGREKMPECFQRLGVLNYSESEIATSNNDYRLIRNAYLVIASASGFSCMPDCMDIPLLSINNWQINGYPGRRTIQIPSVLNINGRKISFEEQIEEFYKLGQISMSTPSPSGWGVVDATSDDILFAVHELMNINENSAIPEMTELQKKFNQLFPVDIPFFGQSRISNDFLNKNSDRF